MNRKVKQDYKELARSLGFNFDEEGGALYCQRGTYDFIIYAQNSNVPYMFTVVVSVQRNIEPLSKETCKQFKNENAPVSSLVQNGSLIMMYLKNFSKQAVLRENLDSAIGAFVSFLQAQGFKNCCQHCGDENPTTCYVAGGYMNLCSNCFSQLQRNNLMEFSQNQSKSENVIGGIVGAFFGSLLGVLSVIIFSQLGYVAVVTGVIMAICTLKGYEMLGGKLTKKGVVISIILMIVMTIVGDQLDWAILISRELEVDYITAFRIFPELLAEGLIDKGIYIGNLVMQYLFVGIGAIPTITSNLKNRKNESRIYRLNGNRQDF